MFSFVFRCNNGTGGSFSIQIPTSSSSLWSSAHVGGSSIGIKRKRVRVGESGWSWMRSNEEQRQHKRQASSSEKPTFKHINRISKGIKAAFEVFQGWKIVQKLHVASQDGALLVGFGAGKWVLLSVKATKFFSIWKGYKFSKSVLTILDPVVGKNGWAFTHVGKGFLVLKSTVGGIGVVVKATLLSKELCIAVLQKLAVSGATFAASLRTGYQRNLIRMLANRSHQSRPKRLSCTAITNEGDFCNLLSASFPRGSLSNDSLFSLILLFKSFAEDTSSQNLTIGLSDHQFIILCLAIPLPSSEILVFV